MNPKRVGVMIKQEKPDDEAAELATSQAATAPTAVPVNPYAGPDPTMPTIEQQISQISTTPLITQGEKDILLQTFQAPELIDAKDHCTRCTAVLQKLGYSDQLFVHFLHQDGGAQIFRALPVLP